MKRLGLGLFLVSQAAFAQLFSFGLKGGVPLTDGFKISRPSSYLSDSKRYTVGPVLELNLPSRISIEGNALYRSVGYQSSSQPGPLIERNGQSWEFPVLLKYRVTSRRLRPFLGAGVAVRNLRGFDEDLAELRDRLAAGAVLGGGLELRILFVRLSGEVRYTRWGSTNFKSALGDFRSQLNQADLLLGITF